MSSILKKHMTREWAEERLGILSRLVSTLTRDDVHMLHRYEQGGNLVPLDFWLYSEDERKRNAGNALDRIFTRRSNRSLARLTREKISPLLVAFRMMERVEDSFVLSRDNAKE